ncbi:GGDEF domain-containing phosphodiesterase [Clostridium sp. AM58-1XD]|uniref:putative bifunctional diguanylate cyclase/phosphodiesterase n=1 Tax=Clostridium sp. AM58-1XD TaxID=2292307 RepID=UPI0015F35CCF|nr:GGDEF domain-containing phosphodiesterase [Clostridium sp. AM58-1XD]
MIQSIPILMINKGQNIRQLFTEQEAFDRLLDACKEQVVSARLKMAGEEQKMVSVALKIKGKQMLFLMCDLQNLTEIQDLMKMYISLIDELEIVQQEPYEESYYEIQKVNNQLINYQRALAKANEQLKMVLEEVRQAKSAIEILERDPLTNLYTQNAFFERAAATLNQRPSEAFDIIVIDIERFKMVNDTFGTAEGDRLLIELANCFLGLRVRDKTLFARARADKFYILAPRMEEWYGEFNRVIDLLVEHYPIPMRLQIKYGVYQIHDRKIGIAGMCDRAMLASNNIKGIFNRRFAIYDESLRDKMIVEQKIINTMMEALEREDFQVYLQPKVEIGTEQLIGAEALVRWKHPEFGMISPGDFIPIFEKNGFIYSMDLFVWRKTCEIIKGWKNDFGFSVLVSVNVSRADIYHSDLPEVLKELVDSYGLQPEDMHLEITESAYALDSHPLLAVTERLKLYGFIIEMDDFGNGYSSLNTLSELPIDVLKMDLEFLRLGDDLKHRERVMQFVINLARELQLQVIAEGAETEEQIELLKEMGCIYAQGYFYGKPVQEEDFRKYLSSGRITKSGNKEQKMER